MIKIQKETPKIKQSEYEEILDKALKNLKTPYGGSSKNIQLFKLEAFTKEKELLQKKRYLPNKENTNDKKILDKSDDKKVELDEEEETEDKKDEDEKKEEKIDEKKIEEANKKIPKRKNSN